MNTHDSKLYPHLQLEENRRALERQRRLRQQIRAVSGARRAERPSRFAALTTRLRSASLRHDPCPPLVEEC
jgi:hypothetical protein